MPTTSRKPSEKPTPLTKKSPDILNLVGIEGPLKNVVFDRRDTKILIGREKGRWKLFIDDEYVSQRHARIYWDESQGVWMVQDRGSSNGTYLNMNEVTQRAVEIRDGDELEFGVNSKFEVQISPCPDGMTKREFLKAEIDIFTKKLKAQTEGQINRMLRHWVDSKLKILQNAGYEVQHLSALEEEHS